MVCTNGTLGPKEVLCSSVVEAYTFDPSTWEVEADGSL